MPKILKPKIQSIESVVNKRFPKKMLRLGEKKPTLRIEWENCYEKEIGVEHQLFKFNKKNRLKINFLNFFVVLPLLLINVKESGPLKKLSVASETLLGLNNLHYECIVYF